jgi:hypothetical protein
VRLDLPAEGVGLAPKEMIGSLNDAQRRLRVPNGHGGPNVLYRCDAVPLTDDRKGQLREIVDFASP